MSHTTHTGHTIEAGRKADIMKAFASGVDVQTHARGGNWIDCTTPTWDWVDFDYRIKPEVSPFRYYNLYYDDKGGLHIGATHETELDCHKASPEVIKQYGWTYIGTYQVKVMI